MGGGNSNVTLPQSSDQSPSQSVSTAVIAVIIISILIVLIMLFVAITCTAAFKFVRKRKICESQQDMLTSFPSDNEEEENHESFSLNNQKNQVFIKLCELLLT